MKKIEIFVDMDECLFSLSNAVCDRVNSDYYKNFSYSFNKSYWWQDFGLEKKYFEELLGEKGLFLNLKPIDGAIECLTKLNEEGYNIHILTTPQYNRYCFYEKVESVKKYLPFVNIETNFHTTGSKGLLGKKNRLLIDDSIFNLESFREAGGVSIAFGNYGWNKDFNGYKADSWYEVYNLIQTISKTYN